MDDATHQGHAMPNEDNIAHVAGQEMAVEEDEDVMEVYTIEMWRQEMATSQSIVPIAPQLSTQARLTVDGIPNYSESELEDEGEDIQDIDITSNQDRNKGVGEWKTFLDMEQWIEMANEVADSIKKLIAQQIGPGWTRRVVPRPWKNRHSLYVFGSK